MMDGVPHCRVYVREGNSSPCWTRLPELCCESTGGGENEGYGRSIADERVDLVGIETLGDDDCRFRGAVRSAGRIG